MHIETAAWRKSSYSQVADCVSFAKLPDGTIAMRSSNRPDDGILVLTPTEFTAWLAGIKAGEFNDLV